MDFLCNIPAELMDDAWSAMCTGYKQHMAVTSRNMTSSSISNSQPRSATHAESSSNCDAMMSNDDERCTHSLPTTIRIKEAAVSRGIDNDQSVSQKHSDATLKGLDRPPSTWLPHIAMDVDSLETLLQAWSWDEKSVCERQLQALVSYGTWLVQTGRLDKVTGISILRIGGFIVICIIHTALVLLSYQIILYSCLTVIR